MEVLVRFKNDTIVLDPNTFYGISKPEVVGDGAVPCISIAMGPLDEHTWLIPYESEEIRDFEFNRAMMIWTAIKVMQLRNRAMVYLPSSEDDKPSPITM